MVGTGSFIGGVSRYLLSLLIKEKISGVFPWATFTVNIIGCSLIGLAYVMMERHNLADEWKLFFTTGILGGFTTFSAFSFEGVQLFREGQIAIAVVYTMTSVIVGLLSTYLSYKFSANLYDHL